MNLPVAITGVSCVTGLGEGLNLLLEAISAKRKPPLKIDPEAFQDEIDEIQKGPYELYRVQKIMAVTVLRALRDAGVSISNDNAGKISVCMGNAYGIEEFKTNFYKEMKNNKPEFTNPSLFPYTTSNSISANLSVLFGIKGKNITFSCGSTSASEGILAAQDILSSGIADIAVVGGENFFCNDFSTEYYNCGFQQESCAALVLQRKQDVVGEDKKIYSLIERCNHGFLCGYANGDDGKDVVIDFDHKLFKSVKTQIEEDIGCVIINHGKSLCDKFVISGKWMNYDNNRKLFILLEMLLGNTFSASGLLGVILSSLLLEKNSVLGIDAKKSVFKKILFININSYGSHVSTVISGG